MRKYFLLYLLLITSTLCWSQNRKQSTPLIITKKSPLSMSTLRIQNLLNGKQNSSPALIITRENSLKETQQIFEKVYEKNNKSAITLTLQLPLVQLSTERILKKVKPIH